MKKQRPMMVAVFSLISYLPSASKNGVKKAPVNHTRKYTAAPMEREICKKRLK